MDEYDGLMPESDSGPLAPLSDERLALLNERFDDAVHALWNLTESPVDGDGLDEYDTVRQCWDELLALLAKRREREAALLAVVRRVATCADGAVMTCLCGWTTGSPGSRVGAMGSVSSPVTHQSYCVFAQARAALAAADAGERA